MAIHWSRSTNCSSHKHLSNQRKPRFGGLSQVPALLAHHAPATLPSLPTLKRRTSEINSNFISCGHCSSNSHGFITIQTSKTLISFPCHTTTMTSLWYVTCTLLSLVHLSSVTTFILCSSQSLRVLTYCLYMLISLTECLQRRSTASAATSTFRQSSRLSVNIFGLCTVSSVLNG